MPIEKFTADPPPMVVDSDGVIRVSGTRVTLDTVIGAYLNGSTAEEITSAYDALNLADVYAIIGYYLHHVDEVQEYLCRRGELAERCREDNELHHPAIGLRERLLSRKREQR